MCMTKIDASCLVPLHRCIFSDSRSRGLEDFFFFPGLVEFKSHRETSGTLVNGDLYFPASASLKVKGICFLCEPIHGTSHIFFLVVASGS